MKAHEIIELGYRLSTYAASVRWDGSPNTSEWLAGLRALIEEFQPQAESMLGEATPVEDLIYVPGDFLCPTCGFRLHKRILRASDGAVGIDVSAMAEECPNDGDVMHPLTWKQDAEDGNRVALDLAKENRRLKGRIDQLEYRN